MGVYGGQGVTEFFQFIFGILITSIVIVSILVSYLIFRSDISIRVTDEIESETKIEPKIKLLVQDDNTIDTVYIYKSIK